MQRKVSLVMMIQQVNLYSLQMPQKVQIPLQVQRVQLEQVQLTLRQSRQHPLQVPVVLQ